jgi:hypothetical protein
MAVTQILFARELTEKLVRLPSMHRVSTSQVVRMIAFLLRACIEWRDELLWCWICGREGATDGICQGCLTHELSLSNADILGRRPFAIVEPMALFDTLCLAKNALLSNPSVDQSAQIRKLVVQCCWELAQYLAWSDEAAGLRYVQTLASLEARVSKVCQVALVRNAQ